MLSKFFKIALFLALVAGIASAQTTTTITGTLRDLSQALITSGKVTFELMPSRDTTISGYSRFSAQTVTCGINGSGQILNQALGGACTVTMNTALMPTGSYYNVCVWPGNVRTSCFTFYAVLASYDWSTVVPTPTTAPAQNFVDIFSNQIIGGNKTFTGNTTFASANFNGICIAASTLATALSCAGSNGTIEVTVAGTSLSSNVTIPAGVTLIFDGSNPGCINMSGFTLAMNGNLINPGPVQIFCGSGTVSGLSYALPEWWGNNGTCVAGACPLVSVAVNALNASTAGTVYLQNAIYRSGFEELVNVSLLTRQGVHIVGAGMPQYNGSFTNFVTGTGTIIQGTWHVEADNFQMRDVGIDVGTGVITTLYGGTDADGFMMNNNGQNVGKAPKQGLVLYNIATLGHNPTALTHSFCIENVTGGYAENLHAVFNTHGVVLKGDHTTLNGLYASGHSTEDVIVKSDDYAPTHDVSLSNIHAGAVTAGDTSTGLSINPGAAPMTNVNVHGVTVDGGVGDGILALLNNTSFRVSISDVNIEWAGGGRQSVCFHVSGSNVGVGWQVVNLTCDNYNFLIDQTQLLNSSQFANIVGTNIGNGSNQGMLLEGVNEQVVNVVESGTFTTGATSDCATCVVRLSNWDLPGFGGTLSSVSNGAKLFPGENSVATYSASGFFGNTPTVTINNSSPINIATSSGSSAIYLLRDQTNGGAAIVLNDANGGPTIIGGVGTTAFVTGAPGATQIQVTNTAGQLKVQGGASRNNAVVAWAELGN